MSARETVFLLESIAQALDAASASLRSAAAARAETSKRERAKADAEFRAVVRRCAAINAAAASAPPTVIGSKLQPDAPK